MQASQFHAMRLAPVYHSKEDKTMPTTNSTRSTPAKLKLKAYTDLLEENDLEIKRLEALTELEKPGVSQQARAKELRERLPEAIREEQARGAELRELVDLIEGPKRREILRLRYFDLLPWQKVCEAVFGDRDDFDRNWRMYQRQTFRIHVGAIEQLDSLIAERAT